MRRIALLVFIFGFIACITAYGEKANLQGFTKDLSERQKEFNEKKEALKRKEDETATLLNNEVDKYNEHPSIATLQKIEDLKISVINILQEELLTSRDYIAYLELRISELLAYSKSAEDMRKLMESGKLPEKGEPGFTPLESQEGADEVTRAARKLTEKIRNFKLKETKE